MARFREYASLIQTSLRGQKSFPPSSREFSDVVRVGGGGVEINYMQN